MSRPIHVGLIGQQFMGRAHSNAWSQVGRFFDLPRPVALHTAAARDPASLADFARRWGWQHWVTDWKALATDPEVELVDIGTPNDLHAPQAEAMLAAGKHVACEKPLAGTLDDARRMRDAAAAAKADGVQTFVWFNYRRCPAVATMHELVRSGRLGALRHVRAHYLQDWGGPETPLSWRFQARHAGSGAHGDLNAHIVDMARFVTGDEIEAVHGALARTFVTSRPLAAGGAATGPSDVDDQVLFLASFRGGASASFEASRLAHGHQNDNSLEINGERGSLRFAFEDMNLLHYCDADDDPKVRGWRRILCTGPGLHPYADAWWADGHLLGYEHGFIHMAADIVRALGGEAPRLPLPDFADAYETQRVLAAALIAAREGRRVALDEVP